ncbi:MAG: type 1 glutamine amidotransferase [Dehalococcoidia bacterium]|nr:type 1 glutamine amidotransferase [Dehalococcoidia bacterium]
MPKLALIIRHAEPETLAENYTSALVQRGFELRPLDVFAGAPDFAEFGSPPLEELDLIIALGGPLSANDPYPALRLERRFLADAMASGVPVFGVCLGAQLMARSLGGQVEPTGGYEFGLRKIWVTWEGSRDPVFGKIRVPLVPTLHGECFTVPAGAVELAFGYMLCRDGTFRRQSLAFRSGISYGFQFEPQLTLDELRVWDRELAEDYRKMGPLFDPALEAETHLREFAAYSPTYEAQSREMLTAFLDNAGLV